MAETTEHIPGRSAAVPWGRFADGQAWRLTRGADFTQHPEAARRAFIAWCSRHGMRSRSSVLDDDTLVVQASRPASPGAAAMVVPEAETAAETLGEVPEPPAPERAAPAPQRPAQPSGHRVEYRSAR